MNKKGLFCFLLVLSFAGAMAVLYSADSEEMQKFSGTKEILFELEKLDLQRTILEENTDFLIKQTMLEEIKKGNNDSEKIKEAVNEKLSLFFEKAEKEMRLNFLTPYSKEFLNENSKALVIEYSGFSIAEYSFTGGILKNNFFRAEIESENAKKIFELPIGYLQKVVQ